MQARINREGEIVVVHLSGRVDVETAEPFREACLNQLLAHKVVFDFKQLSFVGSSGLLPFLETIEEFAGRNSNGFMFCGVGSEFRRVFSSTTLGAVQIFDNHSQAVQAFLNPQPIAVAQAVEVAPVQDEGAVQAQTSKMLAPSPVEAVPILDASARKNVAG